MNKLFKTKSTFTFAYQAKSTTADSLVFSFCLIPLHSAIIDVAQDPTTNIKDLIKLMLTIIVNKLNGLLNVII